MPMNSRQALHASVLVCSITASGCSTVRVIDPVTNPAEPAFARLEVGDTVEVQTRAGVARFVVREIDRDSIVAADGTRYSRGEILQLKRQTTSGVKTTWLIVGIVYTVGLLLNLLL